MRLTVILTVSPGKGSDIISNHPFNQLKCKQFLCSYRKDDFEYSYNVDRFYYSTPFTHSGSAHGVVGEQFKRVTVLTTEFSFPYVKNRLQVVDIKEVSSSLFCIYLPV